MNDLPRLRDIAHAVRVREQGVPSVRRQMRARLAMMDIALDEAASRGRTFRAVDRVNPKTGMEETRQEIETEIGTISLSYSGSERVPLQPRRMRVSGRSTRAGIAATVVLDLPDGTSDPAWTMRAALECIRLCMGTLKAADDPERTAAGDLLATQALGWGTLVVQHHGVPMSPPSLCHARAATPWLPASLRRTRELNGRADSILLEVPTHLPPPRMRGTDLLIDEAGPVVMAITSSILPPSDPLVVMRAIAAYTEQRN